MPKRGLPHSIFLTFHVNLFMPAATGSGPANAQANANAGEQPTLCHLSRLRSWHLCVTMSVLILARQCPLHTQSLHLNSLLL